MFQSEIAGIMFFFIAVFFGPALIMAGFQTMSGQRIRLNSPLRPVCKIVCNLAQISFELSGVVASAVAESLPDKYRHLEPFLRPLVRGAIICSALLLAANFLRSMAHK
jgi:hypothetical protein